MTAMPASSSLEVDNEADKAVEEDDDYGQRRPLDA
jgi:hypothetical protein